MKEKNKYIDFKYNWKTYWSFLRKHKVTFIFLIITISIVELSRLADKLIFKEIIDRGTEFSNGVLPQEPFVKALIIFAIIFGSVVIIRSVFKWIQIHLINKLETNLIINLKQRFYNHISELSYNFHTTHKTGSLISRLGRGSRAIEVLTDVLVFNVVPLILQFIIVFTSLLYFDISSAIVVIVIVVLFIFYSIFIQQKRREASIVKNNCEDIEKAFVADTFTNINSVKYFGKETSMQRRFGKYALATKIAQIKLWDYFKWMDAGHTLILGLGVILLFYFPLKSFVAGNISIGTVAFIYTVYGNLYGPLFRFVHGIRNYYNAMADFEALFAYGKITNEVKDKKNAKGFKVKKGKITFKNVNFAYHKRKFLNEFSLNIPAEKSVAFVGHSGSGKTTLIKLLYRFYDLNNGEILVDGKSIADVKKSSLRSELSIVPQECILFDDTVYNNIAFSRPSASKGEVLQAMKFAQLDKVIENFPEKEKTIVGERGVKLSGGEKQRVSIARAILADKKILVLDEATSALDSETEHEIQKDLEKLMVGRTSIIIAHRLSTIMKADKIVVLDKGKIVQQGTHSKLIKQPGQYKKLCNLQKGGYIK